VHSPCSASDKVYQLLAHGRWFYLGTPASSITKTGRHDIAEILLKVVLNTKRSNQIKSPHNANFVSLNFKKSIFLIMLQDEIYMTYSE
jgi:hypothetical protein